MIRRFRAVIAAAVLALGMLIPALLAPSVALAALTCPTTSEQHYGNTGNPILGILYEGPNWPVGYPDGHTLCIHVPVNGSISIANLKTVAYAYDSFHENNVCYGQLATSYGTWNDCASGVKVNFSCHYSAIFYGDANYTGGSSYSFSASGTVANLATIGQDNIWSSLKITYHSICGGAPAP
jgi:hypothetical protein